jgi:hypothetical protein
MGHKTPSEHSPKAKEKLLSIISIVLPLFVLLPQNPSVQNKSMTNAA